MRSTTSLWRKQACMTDKSIASYDCRDVSLDTHAEMYNAQIATNALQHVTAGATPGTTPGMTAGTIARTNAGTKAGKIFRLPPHLAEWDHLTPTPTMAATPTTDRTVPRSDRFDVEDIVEGIHAEIQSYSSQSSRSPPPGSRLVNYQLFAKHIYSEPDGLNSENHHYRAPELSVRVEYDTGEQKVLPSPLTSVIKYVCPVLLKECWVRTVQKHAILAGIIKHERQDASCNLNPGKLDKKSNEFCNAGGAERNRKYHSHSDAANHDWRRAWTSRGIASPRAPDPAIEAPWLYAEGVDQRFGA